MRVAAQKRSHLRLEEPQVEKARPDAECFAGSSIAEQNGVRARGYLRPRRRARQAASASRSLGTRTFTTKSGSNGRCCATWDGWNSWAAAATGFCSVSSYGVRRLDAALPLRFHASPERRPTALRPGSGQAALQSSRWQFRQGPNRPSGPTLSPAWEGRKQT